MPTVNPLRWKYPSRMVVFSCPVCARSKPSVMFRLLQSARLQYVPSRSGGGRRNYFSRYQKLLLYFWPFELRPWKSLIYVIYTDIFTAFRIGGNGVLVSPALGDPIFAWVARGAVCGVLAVSRPTKVPPENVGHRGLY